MRAAELNLPNLISLGRLLLVPLAAWLIMNGRYGFAFWVLVAAGASDALDGFIAKRFDRRTRLGALLVGQQGFEFIDAQRLQTRPQLGERQRSIVQFGDHRRLRN